MLTSDRQNGRVDLLNSFGLLAESRRDNIVGRGNPSAFCKPIIGKLEPLGISAPLVKIRDNYSCYADLAVLLSPAFAWMIDAFNLPYKDSGCRDGPFILDEALTADIFLNNDEKEWRRDPENKGTSHFPAYDGSSKSPGHYAKPWTLWYGMHKKKAASPNEWFPYIFTDDHYPGDVYDFFKDRTYLLPQGCTLECVIYDTAETWWPLHRGEPKRHKTVIKGTGKHIGQENFIPSAQAILKQFREGCRENGYVENVCQQNEYEVVVTEESVLNAEYSFSVLGDDYDDCLFGAGVMKAVYTAVAQELRTMDGIKVVRTEDYGTEHYHEISLDLPGFRGPMKQKCDTISGFLLREKQALCEVAMRAFLEAHPHLFELRTFVPVLDDVLSQLKILKPGNKGNQNQDNNDANTVKTPLKELIENLESFQTKLKTSSRRPYPASECVALHIALVKIQTAINTAVDKQNIHNLKIFAEKWAQVKILDEWSYLKRGVVGTAAVSVVGIGVASGVAFFGSLSGLSTTQPLEGFLNSAGIGPDVLLGVFCASAALCCLGLIYSYCKTKNKNDQAFPDKNNHTSADNRGDANRNVPGDMRQLD